VTLDKQLIWSVQVKQLGKTVTKIGVFDALVNRRSGAFFRSGVLLYRQLIR
jgi:hypothetical protein